MLQVTPIQTPGALANGTNRAKKNKMKMGTVVGKHRFGGDGGYVARHVFYQGASQNNNHTDADSQTSSKKDVFSFGLGLDAKAIKEVGHHHGR